MSLMMAFTFSDLPRVGIAFRERGNEVRGLSSFCFILLCSLLLERKLCQGFDLPIPFRKTRRIAFFPAIEAFDINPCESRFKTDEPCPVLDWNPESRGQRVHSPNHGVGHGSRGGGAAQV